MRETLREHGIEAQPASEFSTRDEGCWLLTKAQFDGMECRVVVTVGYDAYYVNAWCRCTSYLVYVSSIGNIRGTKIKQSTAVQWIIPYPASTPQYREVQDYIDGNDGDN